MFVCNVRCIRKVLVTKIHAEFQENRPDASQAHQQKFASDKKNDVSASKPRNDRFNSMQDEFLTFLGPLQSQEQVFEAHLKVRTNGISKEVLVG